ncbi:MAG: FecR family protein [Cyanobacteriota bacterium]|nr:FecR family protein [Cyanobacteriota bacterium]
MKAKRLNSLYCGLAIATLSSILIGCGSSPTPTTTSPDSSASSSSPNPATASSDSSSQSTAATLSEIQQQPVWVKPIQENQEMPGQEGMDLQVGETIRTEGEALAEVDLNNGLAFRIGGDATLTLQPNNQLNLQSGEMITWVEPGQTVPAEIVTPGGIAGIRGTTVHVRIPEDPNEEVVFFAWEGKVAVRLPNQTEEVLLEAGQEVRVAPLEKDIAKIRAAVRQLPNEEWKARREKSRLLNKFEKKLPTQDKIEAVEQKMMKMMSPEGDRTPPNRPSGERPAPNPANRPNGERPAPNPANRPSGERPAPNPPARPDGLK